MSSGHHPEGTAVWIANKENDLWESGTLLSDFTGSESVISVLLDKSKKRVQISVKDEADFPPLRNPDILVGKSDLTSLSYLSEPEVIFNLEHRFNRHIIYTWCGIVLIAINPYQSLPIYGLDTSAIYAGNDVRTLDPHIFAVAEDSFQRMADFNEKQSIIISGESGAGKTVSAKYVMRYFAYIGGINEEAKIEKKVLASNPIMEAFGNAKTTRNDNSSRFGKYIEIAFSAAKICGAVMETYLLEKSRVVFQSEGERNYHIFYQLCSQARNPDFVHLRLDSADAFNYTNQGKCISVDTIDDDESFYETLHSLEFTGVGRENQMMIFTLIAALLHIGNIKFEEKDAEGSHIQEADPHLQIACKLLGIAGKHMRYWLCNRKIAAGGEVINTALNLQSAKYAVDALVKFVYHLLFLKMVQYLNRSLRITKKNPNTIGILDIYGFEFFETNSFEQFCINYANEKLQQQFCKYVFKLEQEEYLREDIKWTYIEFAENQPCIDLIEGKLGILDLLDEECKIPKGSDKAWCEKLYAHFNKPGYANVFGKPPTSNSSFIVKHFADAVVYTAEGFMEKNKDTVLEDQICLLKTSELSFVSELFNEATNDKVTSNNTRTFVRRESHFKKTVGLQFKESLSKLMGALDATVPHYVRCIKPNDHKLPFTFDAKRAAEQLKACGVLETVRISAAGFPSRLTYKDFHNRYRILINSSALDPDDVEKSCQTIIRQLIADEDKYQFGKTKIFFRAGQIATLEKMRKKRLNDAATTIQRIYRGYIKRKKYNNIKKSVLAIQTYGRGFLARRLANRLRKEKSVLCIQSVIRTNILCNSFLDLYKSCLYVQSAWRQSLAQREFFTGWYAQCTFTLQCILRAWLCRRAYKRTIRGITKMQGLYRVHVAKEKLKKLKTEAGSINQEDLLKDGMKLKVFTLQQKVTAQDEAMKNLSARAAYADELEKQIVSLHSSTVPIEEYQAAEQEIESLKSTVASLQETNDNLTSENTKLTNTIEELTKEELENSKKILESEEKNKELEDRLKALETESQTKLDELKEALMKEKTDLETVHQKLISDYNNMSMKYENLILMNETGINTDSDFDELQSTSSTNTQLSETNAEKLLRKIRQLQRDKERLLSELNAHSDTISVSSIATSNTAYDKLKMKELEKENLRLLTDLNTLRKIKATNDDGQFEKTITDQLINCEADRENLNEQLLKMKASISNFLEVEYSDDVNLDGLLTEKINTLRDSYECIVQDLKADLKRERMRQQEEPHETVGDRNAGDSVLERNQLLMKENAELRQAKNKLWESFSKAKRQLKYYYNLAKQNERNARYYSPEIKTNTSNVSTTSSVTGMDGHVVRGMIEIKPDKVDLLIKKITFDLDPTVACRFVPGFPAYVVFMCVRYADWKDDSEMAKKLLRSMAENVRCLMDANTHGSEFSYIAYWFVTDLHMIRLLELSINSPQPTVNTMFKLQNFFLIDFFDTFREYAVWMYRSLVQKIVTSVKKYTVAAILHNKRMETNVDKSGQTGMDNLLRILNVMFKNMRIFAIPAELRAEIFCHVFKVMNAVAFNALLVTQDLCNWDSAMTIRYNLSCIENWIRKSEIAPDDLQRQFEPLIEAVQLLQSVAECSNNPEFVKRYTSLQPNQIVKLLELYTPEEEHEVKVTPEFIDKVKSVLPEFDDESRLFLDTEISPHFSMPSNFEVHPLNSIVIPDIMQLNFIRVI